MNLVIYKHYVPTDHKRDNSPAITSKKIFQVLIQKPSQLWHFDSLSLRDLNFSRVQLVYNHKTKLDFS